ncbi:MAG: YkgJ family cysteine cluster protein [Candidatus Hodarchaeota archaeon]
MSYRIKKIYKNKIDLEHECVKCGECCKASYNIYIVKEDIKKWMQAGKIEYLQHIEIDPNCISPIGLSIFNSERRKAIKIIKKKFNEKDSYSNVEKLIEFIKKNHFYQGKDSNSYPLYTILPNMKQNPILIPKNFNIVLEGFEWGLTYKIKLNPNGYCPFLKLNLCSIHEIKPKVCKKFPYNENGNLREDNNFLSICKGLKINNR